MGDFGYGNFDSMDTGGGFMRSPDKSNSKNDKKPRDKMSIIPVTIKQIYSAEPAEEAFRVDGVIAHMVRIVGTIEAVEKHSTNCLYRINDNTGSLDCKLWNDATNPNMYDDCVVNSSVCIVGNIKDYESKKSVQIMNMHAITDWNERTHHFLEVIFVHLQNTRGHIPGSMMKQEYSHSFNTPSMDVSANKRGLENTQYIYVEGKQIQAHSNPEINRFYIPAILKRFQTVFEEQGISKHELLSHMRRLPGANNFSDALFNEAVKALDNTGYIYCTLDDEFYACSIDWNSS